MASRPQNTQNFHAYYQLAAAYGGRKYHEASNWIINQSMQAYSKWPTVRTFFWSRGTTSVAMGKAFVNRHFQAVNTKLPILATSLKNKFVASYAIGRAFAGNHIRIITSCGAAGVALGGFIYYWKNKPEYPLVKLVSSLNSAVLRIEVPKAQYKAPNFTLTFCIDVSSSMDVPDRIGAVKAGIGKILDHAQGILNVSSQAKIGLAVVQFNTNSEVVTPFTRLAPSGNQPPEQTVVGQLKTQVNSLTPSGGTSIQNGLERATKELENAAKVNPSSSQVLIFLTDGEDGISSDILNKIHTRLAAVSAKLFAIGIGKDHKKETLQNIAGSQSRSFQGTYIDTTQPGITIEGAIRNIYLQAIAQFKEMTLTSPQLPPETWGVTNATQSNEKGQYGWNLGDHSEGTTVNRGIWIDWKKLTGPLELSDVSFTLAFTDPQGRRGILSVPWNPNTSIDPEVIKSVFHQ